MSDAVPFQVTYELEGWELFWTAVEIERDAPDEMAALREEVAKRARQRFRASSELAQDPTVSALRRLFRAAGCDPTRYRPSSEALLRRLLKGDALPEIHPLVDFNNCLSAELAVPCCVMAENTFATSLVLRAGREGESYESLRGPFKLAGKPLLADGDGPVDTPITGNTRVKVQDDTRRAWLAAYLPAAVLDSAAGREVVDRLQEYGPLEGSKRGRNCGIKAQAYGQKLATT